MKVKEKLDEVYTTSKRVFTNLEVLAQATALLVISVFSYWALHQIPNIPEVVQWVVTGSLVATALRAFYEYYRFLNK